MELRRLRLKNVRSYTDVDLTFRSGTTLIVGDVGAGKTSLLYAIEMALFGFAEVDPTYLVRHDTSTAEVALTLEEGEHQYGLTRHFRRKGRRGRDVFELVESSFTSDGATMQYPATELRQRVIDLLGFPDNPNPRARSDFWRWAVYVPQERMREVLQQDPDERLETVRKALGVEQYRTAADNAIEVARELKQRAEKKEAEAERLRFFDHELERSAHELVVNEGALQRIAQEEVEIGEQLTALEIRVREAEATRVRQQSLREEIARLTAELGDLERGIQRRKGEIAERTRTAETLQEEIRRSDAQEADMSLAAERQRALTAERDQLRDQVAALRSLRVEGAGLEADLRSNAEAEAQSANREAQLNGELEELRRSLGALDTEGPKRRPPEPTPRTVPEIERRWAELSGLAASVLRESAQLEASLADTNQLLSSGVCPRCHQAVVLSTFESHQTELTRAAESARTRASDLRKELEGTEAERRSRERYERSLGRWEEVERHRQTLRESEERARIGQTSVREQRTRDAQRASDLLARRTLVLPQLAELDRLEGELQALEIQLEQAEGSHREHLRLRERALGLGAQLELLRQVLASLTTGERADSTRQIELVGARERLIGQSADPTTGGDGLEVLAGQLTAARERSRGLSAERATAVTLSAEARRRRTEAERGIADRTELQRAAGHLRKLALWLQQPFRDSVLTLERRLLAQARFEFDHRLTRYFAFLVEDPALLARSDPDFSPAVEIDGAWTPPEALSGGERTALALAFRLALGEVVRSLGHLKLTTVILDEPTEGFSPEQVTRLGELLEEAKLPQVILVSHETQLTSIADHVIRVTKEEGSSRLNVLAEGPSVRSGPAPTTFAPPITGGPRIRTLDEDGTIVPTTRAGSRTSPDPTAHARRGRGSRKDAPGSSAR
jgi:DNA repair protein SbcC/Rad50